jgi:hypothetical protein
MFSGCKALEKIDIPSGIVTIEGSVFGNCEKLKSIALPDGLTSIGEYAFGGCTALKTVTFPASLQSLGNNAFSNCAALKEVHFLGDYPKMAYSVFTKVTATMYYPRENATWKNGNVLTGGGNMSLMGVTTATSGSCGENLTWKFSGGVLTISGTGEMEVYTSTAPWAYYADRVTKVVIEDGVTTISYKAFFEFTALEKVVLGSGLKRIGGQAFRGCKELEKVDLPDGLEYIGDFSFMDCKKLQTVVIPASVKQIDVNAFKNCKAMTTVYFAGSAPDMDYPFLNMTATVYYPVGDSSWNGSTMKQYGGKLTWKKYCPAGHTFGDWAVLEEATYEKAGLQERTCAACGEKEQQVIPMLKPTQPPTEPETQPTAPSTAPTEPATKPSEPPARPTLPTTPSETPQGGVQQPESPVNWLVIAIVAVAVCAAGIGVYLVFKKKKA